MVIDTQDIVSPLARRAATLIDAVTALFDQSDTLARAASDIAAYLSRGGTVFTAGNGGAAGLAEHFAGELLGRLSWDRERPPLPARSLCSDTVVLTGIAQTEGFDRVYAAQLERSSRVGDVLVVFTTSGRSPNLVQAVATAGDRGLYRVAFTGMPGSPMDQCEAALHVPTGSMGTVQECHLLLLHALVESVEDSLLGATRCAGQMG